MNEQLIVFAMRGICSRLETASHAADTVSGIHLVWINWAEPTPPQAITLQALQRLEANGLVERVAIQEGELWKKSTIKPPSPT